MNDYVVCWIDSNHPKWKVVSGYDAMQELVSDLVYQGIKEDDIVVGEITEDTK